MADEPIVLRCGHCGNTTAFSERAKYECDDYADYQHLGLMWRMEWRILQCPACEKPTLHQTATGLDSHGNEAIEARESVLYPAERTISKDLPGDIAAVYSVAVGIAPLSPGLCAVQVAKTLEAICRREGAHGRNLQQRLEYLANSGRIPETLGKMAQQVRQIRNLGAHADSGGDEVKESDVPVILDFMDAILEYLYVLPAKMAAVESRLNRKGK